MFIIAPVKGFRLVRKTQECTTVLFHKKKTKKKYQKSKENMLLKTYFCYLSYSTWARRCAKHARYVGTWARKHARHFGTWAHKDARHVGMWACKHARHIGTWACKNCSCCTTPNAIIFRFSHFLGESLNSKIWKTVKGFVKSLEANVW